MAKEQSLILLYIFAGCPGVSDKGQISDSGLTLRKSQDEKKISEVV